MALAYDFPIGIHANALSNQNVVTTMLTFIKQWGASAVSNKILRKHKLDENRLSVAANNGGLQAGKFIPQGVGIE